jgi:hypothetical protein
VGELADEGPGRDVRAETGLDGQGDGGQRAQCVAEPSTGGTAKIRVKPAMG